MGGGTGMVCHGFKGGIGTASRGLPEPEGGYTVGALVQANYGRRERLAIDGVPVGREIGFDVVPFARAEATGDPPAGRRRQAPARSSWCWPPMPRSCPTSATARPAGGPRRGPHRRRGENSSGDLFLAFATGNPPFAISDEPRPCRASATCAPSTRPG